MIPDFEGTAKLWLEDPATPMRNELLEICGSTENAITELTSDIQHMTLGDSREQVMHCTLNRVKHRIEEDSKRVPTEIFVPRAEQIPMPGRQSEPDIVTHRNIPEDKDEELQPQEQSEVGWYRLLSEFHEINLRDLAPGDSLPMQVFSVFEEQTEWGPAIRVFAECLADIRPLAVREGDWITFTTSSQYAVHGILEAFSRSLVTFQIRKSQTTGSVYYNAMPLPDRSRSDVLQNRFPDTYESKVAQKKQTKLGGE